MAVFFWAGGNGGASPAFNSFVALDLLDAVCSPPPPVVLREFLSTNINEYCFFSCLGGALKDIKSALKSVHVCQDAIIFSTRYPGCFSRVSQK